jgi:hypothetical protein
MCLYSQKGSIVDLKTSKAVLNPSGFHCISKRQDTGWETGVPSPARAYIYPFATIIRHC